MIRRFHDSDQSLLRQTNSRLRGQGPDRQESASADGVVGPAIDDEIIFTEVEQAKHLMTYDLGLAETDAGWHSPLMTFATMRVMKNMRVRSQAAENWRRERWQEKNEQYKQNREDHGEERRERRDSVPPMQLDSFRNTILVQEAEKDP